MLALSVARQASRSCPLRGEPLGVEELVARHVHAPQRLLRRVELLEHGHLVAALDGDYEIFTEVDFEEGNKFDDYFEEWEVIGKKYWEYALYTAAREALPQNLAPGLVMAGEVNGLGMEPAAISGIYAANKILGKTVD